MWDLGLEWMIDHEGASLSDAKKQDDEVSSQDGRMHCIPQS